MSVGLGSLLGVYGVLGSVLKYSKITSCLLGAFHEIWLVPLPGCPAYVIRCTALNSPRLGITTGTRRIPAGTPDFRGCISMLGSRIGPVVSLISSSRPLSSTLKFALLTAN